MFRHRSHTAFSPGRARRSKAARAGALCSVALAAGLSTSCSRGDGVPPGQVQRFLVVKEVTDNLTRLIEFVGTAEQGIQTLSQQRPGTVAARRFLSGAKTGWQNVVVETTNFTPAQAKVVPGLANAVIATHESASQWLLGLVAVSNQIDTGSVGSFQALAPKFALARTDETKARASLATAARTLARMACSLETAHPGLAPAGAAAGDCAAASGLESSTP